MDFSIGQGSESGKSTTSGDGKQRAPVPLPAPEALTDEMKERNKVASCLPAALPCL